MKKSFPDTLTTGAKENKLGKKYAILCAFVLMTLIALIFNDYQHGLQLKTISVFSFQLVLIWVMFIITIYTLIFTVRVIIDHFKNCRPKTNLLVILLFPIALSPRFIKEPPSFTDGAAYTLKNLNLSEQLVAAAAREIAIPQKENEWRFETERINRVMKTYPFSQLGLGWPSYPKLRIKNSSLLFEFGSAIAFRWGLSISGIKGVPPTIPQDVMDLRSVSTEIIVFTGPAD